MIWYLSSITDLDGNTLTLTYTGNLITQITDATNRSLTLAYTSGRLTSVIDPLVRKWTLAYDGVGALLTVTLPQVNGQSYYIGFGYDGNHNLTSIQNALGKTNTFHFTTVHFLDSMFS